MKDSFFSGVDWKVVLNKNTPSPLWKPQLWRGSTDISAFDETFTKEAPVDSVDDEFSDPATSTVFRNFSFGEGIQEKKR